MQSVREGQGRREEMSAKKRGSLREMEKRRQERQEARMGGYGMEKERQEIRLNKFLSESGFCSRREADRLIEAGKVLVDGAVASMGMKIREGQQIEADGTLISGKDRPVVLLVNKPRGLSAPPLTGTGQRMVWILSAVPCGCTRWEDSTRIQRD